MALTFDLTANNSGFMRALDEVTAGVRNASRQIEAHGGDIDRVINLIKTGVTSLGVGVGFKEFAGQIFSIRDEFQKLEITFGTLLGSAEKAQTLMSQLMKTAAITPFAMTDVTEGAKSLLAYGVAAEDVNDTLIGLGDIAAGLKIPLTDLTYLYGTTITQGRMFTQDLRQFQGRGIPIAEELTKVLGKPKEKIGELVTAGQVTSDVFIQAMKNMTAEGSKFGGLMEAQSKSLNGQYENIKDTIDQMFNEIGKSSEGIFNTVLSTTGDSLDFIQKHLEEIGIAVTTAISAFGINKAALMVNSAVDKAITNYGYNAEIAELEKLLPLKKEEEKTDLQRAVASGQLTETKAAQIAAMRAEAEEQLKLLESKERDAKKNYDSATNDVNDLIEWKNSLDDQIQSMNDYMDTLAEGAESLENLADMDEYEAAQSKLNTLEKERNAVSNELNAATERQNAAATNLATASTERETLANGINTASTNANTAATNMLTVAKKACINAAQKLWAVMAANPLGTVVVTLGAMYYAFTKILDAEGKAAEISEKFGESTSKQISRIDTLCDILNGSTKGTKTYCNAVNDLNEELKKHGIEQIKESDNLDLINEKRQLAIELIKQEAIERNRANQIQSNDESYQNILKDARIQLEKDLSVANTNQVLGMVNLANTEIRDKSTQIATIISDIVTQNISEIAGKTGKGYEEGIAKIYGEIQESMRKIGLSEETIHAVWSKYGISGTDFLNVYIKSVTEATEAHDAEKESIEDTAKSLRDAEAANISYSDKVESTRKKLENCASDVNSLYDAIKNLMSKYQDNTIGFHIKFTTDNPPKWMEKFTDNELKNLSTKFGAIGDSLKEGQTAVIGNARYTKQEALQRSADYAQTLKNRSDKKKDQESRWNTIEAEIKSKKDEAHKYAKGSKEALAIYKEIDKLESEKKGLGDYDRDHKKKKSSGPTADQIESKQTEAHQKLIDLMKQQAEERLRLQQDYEYQQWQNRIDLMDEGEAKIIAQMELDHKKEQTSLEEQKKQAIQAEIARQKALFDAREDEKAAGNKKYAKQVFDPTTIYDPDNKVIDPEIQKVIDRYDSLNADLLAKQQKAEADRLQAAKESFNAYLQEFGTYQQKREAIATDYDTRIAAAANAGERMTLEAQKNKALSDLDYQQWIDSEEIALAFGDISNLSRQTISRLIEDMEKYREKVVATFDPEKIEKYNEALNNLRMADVENSFSAFGSMVPEYFTKRLAIQKQINDEAKIGLELIQRQNELNIRTEAKKGAIKIQAKSSGYNITDEDLADPNRIQQIADKISVSAANGGLFAAALHSALLELLKLNGEDTELANATQKWDGNFSHLKETLANLEGEAKFKAIAEAVGNAAGLIGNLAGQASEMSDAIGAEGLGEALGYLGDAMGSVQNIASGFAQGGIVGGIAAAAGEVMNWVTKLAMAGDARHQKNIERIQERIDALQKSYDRLGESAEKAYSTDASEMIDQQNTLLKQQQILIRQQMAEEEAKKKTDKDKIKEYQEQLEEIDALLAENADKAKEAIIGKDIKSAIDEFASLYAEAWDDGTDAAQKSMQAVKSIISSALTELLKKNIQPAAQNFYDTLAKAMEDGILTDAELANLDTIKAQMNALAASGEEQYKKIQERYKDLDELREELTDISFDSVRDNFKSLLSDMTSTTEDFTENWTDMIRNALIEGLMDSKYDALLKEWYAEFAEAMNDQTLTDSERDALRQQYDAIVQQGIADRNAINAIVGGGAYSQQASSGSAWNMNQETGEELNGRFTAMVELEATNNVLVSDGNAIAREILVTLRSMSGLSMTVTGNGDNETLLAIKDMIFLSTGYLEDIAKYSKLLSVISSDVAEMKEKVKDI